MLVNWSSHSSILRAFKNKLIFASKMDEILSLPQPFGLSLSDVRQGNSGSEDIVTDLYVKLRPALVSYVYHLTCAARDAEDVVQIAFLQLFEQLNKGAEIQNVRGWLYRVAHNLAIDEVRQVGRRQTIFEKWLPEYYREADKESVVQTLITREAIEIALMPLNEKEQQCLMLRAEGLSYEEIADVIDTTTKSVSVYLARGLKKFESNHEEKKQ